jgi:hypothetical protein
MNSAQTNGRQAAGPKLSKRQREEVQRDEYFATIVSENLQLQRTLWLVLRTSGSQTATIDQKDMSLLWKLSRSSVPDEPSKITLTAELFPEATSEQIGKLRAGLLADPNRMEEIRSELGLADHPAGYLQGRLMEGADGITWDDALKKFRPIHPPAQEPPSS